MTLVYRTVSVRLQLNGAASGTTSQNIEREKKGKRRKSASCKKLLFKHRKHRKMGEACNQINYTYALLHYKPNWIAQCVWVCARTRIRQKSNWSISDFITPFYLFPSFIFSLFNSHLRKHREIQQTVSFSVCVSDWRKRCEKIEWADCLWFWLA